MKIIKLLAATGLVLGGACVPALAQNDQLDDLVSYVNPFVGTDNQGDTFPGAVAPFGLVQMNPNWKSNGYYYTDTHMHGFVVNLMSGDGGDNEGEALMTATTGPVKIDRDSTDFTFDHQHESASAGYYQVLMQPWNINAELTATAHCGSVRYTFPAGQQANIILPISYANRKVFASHVHLIDPSTVAGSVSCESFNGYHKPIVAYFVMRFSTPFASHGTWTNTQMHDGTDSADSDNGSDVVGFYGSYPQSPSARTVTASIGLSYTDEKGAIANLKAEMPTDDFDAYHKQTVASWNKELSAIQVKGGDRNHNRIFYTALYHVLIAPLVLDDVDGRYHGFDDQIHQVAPGHHFYATFSGWDIYRSEIPLLTLIAPQRVADMAQSLVEEYKQLGFIDRWTELFRETACMNGDPLTIALAHIWNAGVHDFDMETAYKAMFAQTGPGKTMRLNDYENYDGEKDGLTISPESSVASALEHYDSFAALSHLATTLGKTDDAKYLADRAMEYRKWYNPSSGFLQKHTSGGGWDEGFGGYTEGNKWIYLWYVPEDVQGLIDLMGGPATFESRLDQFFNTGWYDPTNEPDLQAPFLYNYINRAWKSQALVARAADEMFIDEPGGLAGGGNDDLGTMSAWYILTQLGFYPVDSGVPYFEVCTPRFAEATIRLQAPYAGKQFVIKAADASPDNVYIQSSVLNGKPLVLPWFPESAITGGGTWEVKVGPAPDKSRDNQPYSPPSSLATGFTQAPAFTSASSFTPALPTDMKPWHYTTTEPGSDWASSDFNADSWQQGPGGFGTDAWGISPRTRWNTDNIWMRKTFDKPESNKLAVVAFHDQGVEIYVNGEPAGQASGSAHEYQAFPLSQEIVQMLKPKGNVLAIHVKHSGGGLHFADAGIAQVQ
jgi:predicted alpha-1,2-mannosidase